MVIGDSFRPARSRTGLRLCQGRGPGCVAGAGSLGQVGRWETAASKRSVVLVTAAAQPFPPPPQPLTFMWAPLGVTL